MTLRPAFALLALLVLLAACTSPEAERGRGAGAKSGADPGNWGQVVQMHEGADPYYQTRRLIGELGMAEAESGQQGRRSRPKEEADAR
jgi:hypothetical protein